MNTQELVERCIKRDRKAWTEFVREYEGLVKRAVWYKINRMNSKALMSDLEDIVQEVFLMLWDDNKPASVRDTSKLKGWLVIVAINKTINYAKRRWNEEKRTRSLDERLLEGELTLEDVIPSGALDSSKALEFKEMSKSIRRSVKMLKEKERRVLELNLYGGKRQVDIAEVMDIPVGTVSTLISRGKRKVQESIREYQLT